VTVIAKGRGGHDPESGLSATEKKCEHQSAGVKYHVVKMFVEVEV